MIIAISTVIALAPAIVVSSAFSRVKGIRNYLASLIKPPGGTRWYLIAILLLPAVRMLQVAVAHTIGQEIAWRPIQAKGELQIAGMVAFVFVYQFIYSNCLGEEVGWRGFALPRLQTRYSPLVASIIIGFFWALWHLPWWRAELGSFTSKYWLFVSGITFACSFILTWLYNRSGGSILAVGLMHVSSNLSVKLVGFTWIWLLLMMLVALIVIVADKMWQKLPSDNDGGLDSVPRK
jgi:membrane protease YdiL (CAAX protease family)